MSRIIVKGLPVYLTDDKLKEHFTKRLIKKHGNTTHSNDLITDVKILKDKNGQSRRFAFIGFRNEDDALDCIKYFNGSFVDTAKIEVSMAKSFADPTVPQSMKEKRREAYKRLREREEKLLEEKSKKPKPQQNNQKSSIDAEIEKDKQLKEFIQTMNPTANTPSWENVSTSNPLINEVEENESESENPLLAQALALKDTEVVKDQESDDEYVDFKTTADTEGQDEEAKEEEMMSLDNFADNVNEDDADNIAQDDKVSDLDWFKQRRVRIREGENVPVKQSQSKSADAEELNQEELNQEEANEDENEVEPDTTEEEKIIQKITKTGRLFLRNILYNSTEQDFERLFSPFGELEEVHIAIDTRTGQSKGFAYILFKDPKDAVQAYIELDKQIFQGRLLHILAADAKKSHRLDEFDLKNMPLKKQKELKRKDTASRQTFSWNSLYMNQDAVLSSVANKLGIEKSQLIDAENSNSAVKQALAEAHVIGDVRKYFEVRGVDLAKFAEMRSTEKKDDTVILVKNFPFGTTREELGELFLPFGKLERLLMPPAGTIAIVQYRDVPSAKKAFMKLAYKRFKDTIIYLEKGPKNCFTREAQDSDTLVNDDLPAEEIKEAKPSVSDIMETTESSNNADDTADDIHDGPTVSIFIKNLNFTTTTQQLTQRFNAFNGFVVAQVRTKPDPKHQGKTQSMGFGFAEFRTKEQALAVISAVDGTVIDGHKVQLKLSHRQGGSTGTSKSKGKQSGKIIVKNLPFEATRKDIFDLFSSFGQLKSVRVPKKFDKSARGFAFIEFLLPKEAENAMDQLQGVHLLGRRLVMQYAQEEAVNAEEEISRMTQKARKQMATREYGALKKAGGRRKLDLDEGDGLDSM
ncbi:hypothetical protein Kpol_1018p135 [Vanderwaltozyma polyspora DSM 70294]|uniref:Multiple RNA-binding domain-containing protein 1 n=1 Tax=Vanderwaltozyma polyspora (strain ATCC 22028 / DSM 70294 / BCRC 21397 / CBS 2163 / NBRC 10782 / NRRL Y-8283 / UCD 57-17) TaxID=436907 RepID=A7TDX7_VANPO|nr:uncharacterized protein Kpol_1018p135 [Vanderwaltozyma polyspora DSM 70294]EDO19597.1 hypothetical protein Kpol_1018p135 [Vanderwaltozyma polyspora DSM 70294]